MALIKCKECGSDVSSIAAACPKCGAPVASTSTVAATAGRVWTITKLLIGAVLLITIFRCINTVDESRHRTAQTVQQLTPEQVAAKAKEDADINRALAAARVIKSRTKDPESFKLESFLYYPGGAVCIEFRAKNSFGAVVPGKGAFDGGSRILSTADGNKFVALWNEICTKGGGQERAKGINALGAI